MNILPLTPGLLISMALRDDHSFGILMQPFETGTLEAKQKKRISEAFEIYKAGGADNRQLIEEMTGQGFYRLDLEGSYQNMATAEALNHAIRCVEDFNT